jgi:enoyl-CoA hydratase/carnithine racemase
LRRRRSGGHAGCELALHCDIRIGSPAATFIMPLAKLGLVVPCEPAERLVAVAGKTAAADMLLTGDAIDASRAERIGLLTRLVAADQLEAQTEAIARRIADNAPLSLRAMKAMLAALGSTFDAGDLERFDDERVAISRSQDMREGLQAFFQRRPPRFTGA